MATVDQIAELRRLINELTEATYTDLVLSARLDAVGNVEVLASTIWQEKAATYAGLIDVQEGSSNRKMSQLYTQALKMAGSFGTDLSGRRPTRTRQIERP